MKKFIVGLITIFFILIISGCDLKDRIDSKMSENKQTANITNEKNDEVENKKNTDKNKEVNNEESNYSNKSNQASNTTDNQIETYFESEANYIENNMNEQTFTNIKDKAINFTKDGIDFIFYGKEINGITFKELSEETKQKIIDLVNKIDNKIMEYDPDYKETIGNKYEDVKDFTKDSIQKGKDKIKETIGEDTYSDIINKSKEIIEKDKEIISDLWDKGKNWLNSKKS